jgi:hypothetical protein
MSAISTTLVFVSATSLKPPTSGAQPPNTPLQQTNAPTIVVHR